MAGDLTQTFSKSSFRPFTLSYRLRQPFFVDPCRRTSCRKPKQNQVHPWDYEDPNVKPHSIAFLALPGRLGGGARGLCPDTGGTRGATVSGAEHHRGGWHRLLD